MDRLRIPEFLYTQTAHLVDAFCEIAAAYGQSRQEAESLFRILPQGVKYAPAFLDSIGKRWRYDYGDEIDGLPNNQVAFGIHHSPEVEHLFLGIRAITTRFTDVELKIFLERLTPPSRHHEVLFELAPLIRVGDEVSAKFEVVGLGPGNTTVDWLFAQGNQTPVLLDVKYRHKDLVDHLKQIASSVSLTEPEAQSGPADPGIFFKSLVSKFNPADPAVQLQGGWIHSTIKPRRYELEQFFLGLDLERLHFGVLNMWGPKAYIVARPEVDVDYLCRLFKLEHSDDFVFDEAAVEPPTKTGPTGREILAQG